MIVSKMSFRKNLVKRKLSSKILILGQPSAGRDLKIPNLWGCDRLLDFLQTAGKNNRGLIWCLIFYRKQEKVTGLVVENILLDFLTAEALQPRF